MGVSKPDSIKKLAYQTWYKRGQNYTDAHRLLKMWGYCISRQSLYRWAKKYNWKARAARAEAVEMEIEESASWERLLKDALARKRTYDKHFEENPGAITDISLEWAYQGLLKSIERIKRTMENSPVIEDETEDEKEKKLDEMIRATYGVEPS